MGVLAQSGWLLREKRRGGEIQLVISSQSRRFHHSVTFRGIGQERCL
jgi:hypothetical protein